MHTFERESGLGLGLRPGAAVTPITIWCKIFDSIIALYGSEVWGPLSIHDYTTWDNHPTEALHAEFCRSVLNVQSKTPNNACRAELGCFPLAPSIKKNNPKILDKLKQQSQQQHTPFILSCYCIVLCFNLFVLFFVDVDLITYYIIIIIIIIIIMGK